MIRKGVILFSVQGFQQGSAWVSTKVDAQFVDLVEHKHRVDRFCLAHGLDNTPGKSANVGAAVATYLRFVAYSAQAHTDEIAPQCLGDRFADRRLACTWRPDKAEDWAAHLVGRQLVDGNVLQDALFDLF